MKLYVNVYRHKNKQLKTIFIITILMNTNLNSVNNNIYEFNQPWRDDKNYFNKYKEQIPNNNIENSVKQQLETLDRTMDNIDYYMYISFYFCYDTPKEFDETTYEISECKGVDDTLNNYNYRFLIVSFYKLIPCILIQLVVNPINIYYAITDSDNLCKNQNSVFLKLVAIVMTTFLTISSFTAINTEIEKYGSSLFWFSDYYKGVRNFYNRGTFFTRMMSFFFFVNIYSAILTTIGTVFIIYNSDGVLEIVLNAMALKFIDEIDNISISKEEEAEFKKLYEKIKDDIIMYQMDREYTYLLGDPNIVRRNKRSYGEIMFILCSYITTILTPAIVGYSVIYLGICY